MPPHFWGRPGLYLKVNPPEKPLSQGAEDWAHGFVALKKDAANLTPPTGVGGLFRLNLHRLRLRGANQFGSSNHEAVWIRAVVVRLHSIAVTLTFAEKEA